MKKWFAKAIRAVRYGATAPIRFYRKYLSPLKKTPTCRFTPTCSQYCIEAIMEWGILCGGALGVWRILRCNPFGRAGYDPVPKRKRRREDNPSGTE